MRLWDISQIGCMMVIQEMDGKIPFEQLVNTYSGELYRYLWRMFGERSEAQDCLQDTFLRAYKAYSRLENGNNLRAWLYKIATNTARTQFKKGNRQASKEYRLDMQIASADKSPEGLIEEQEKAARVYAAVMKLPLKQRAALMMRKYQELNYADIASALNCSQESARANVYQALRKIRNQFAKEVMA